MLPVYNTELFDDNDIDGLFQAVESQSNMLYYSSFSVLPLKIVTFLFVKDSVNPSHFQTNTPLPTHKQKQKPQTSCVYISLCDSANSFAGRSTSMFRGEWSRVSVVNGFVGSLSSGRGSIASPPGGDPCIFFAGALLCLLCALLPRSNLDASGSMTILYRVFLRPIRAI